MRRLCAQLALVLAALIASPASPHSQRGPTVSSDLAHVRGDRVRVIIQSDTPSALARVRGRLGGALRRDLGGAVALDVTRADLAALRQDSSIDHISGDMPVTADMAITNKVTRAESVWGGSSGLLGLFGSGGYNGSGITVAVVDSGIAPHSAIGDRVIARANFVSDEPGVSGDPFGHGTHIAGMIGGSGSAARYVTSAYTGGSAPNVRFVDVRVLGRTGMGYTSDVIAGLDWAVANRTKYGIRIINLSLGHPVAEPAATDPLCRAVERAVAAGIIVVASAGNYGMTAEGAPVLGGISSPGNSPAAITVGALDTAGTIDTRDDKVAAYSSRGPTRFDFAIKPDVVAPGSRVVSLEALNSFIASKYPQWHVAGSGKNSYGRLSGTSMATAVVSGGVALLLDAHPGMSPAQVKVALQTGARFLPTEGLIGAGAGVVDFQASLKIANSGLLNTLLTTVDNLLGTSTGASFRDSGRLIERIYDRTGIRLLSILQLDELLGGADTAEDNVLSLLGLSNPIGQAAPNYVVWGSMAGWTSSYYVVWGSSMQSPSGQYVVWGSATDEEYVVWGSSFGGRDQ